MKEGIPERTKKYVSFEDIGKELESLNAISTGGNCGNPYVVICEDRRIDNCGKCNLNKDCPKAILDFS